MSNTAPKAIVRPGDRARDGALFLGGLGLAAGLHLVDPTEASIATCPFRSLTALACPGCGTLRCLHALLSGDLGTALDLNALTVLVLPLLVAAWLLAGNRAVSARAPTVRIEPVWLGRTLAVGTALFWVLRNLPWEPFRWLAP